VQVSCVSLTSSLINLLFFLLVHKTSDNLRSTPVSAWMPKPVEEQVLHSVIRDLERGFPVTLYASCLPSVFYGERILCVCVCVCVCAFFFLLHLYFQGGLGHISTPFAWRWCFSFEVASLMLTLSNSSLLWSTRIAFLKPLLNNKEFATFFRTAFHRNRALTAYLHVTFL
jgi:hypothetical protein